MTTATQSISSGAGSQFQRLSPLSNGAVHHRQGAGGAPDLQGGRDGERGRKEREREL